MSPDPLYILGAGMHPWGKWGRDFTEYGVVAARAALAEAGLDWRQIQLVAGADDSAAARRQRIVEHIAHAGDHVDVDVLLSDEAWR